MKLLRPLRPAAFSFLLTACLGGALVAMSAAARAGGLPSSLSAESTAEVPTVEVISQQPGTMVVSRLSQGPPFLATDPLGQTDVLIELDEPPLAALAPGLRARPLTLAGLRAQRRKALERLRDTVVSLENRHRGRRGQPPLGQEIVRRQYTDLFHGLAARISPETAEELRELPGVRRVVPDRRVRSLLDTSVVQIQADRVWDELGATGQGVTVAVIDTGIDYTHPDLGGCFGAGCKVVGGHDFANDDADPFDDNGHGTHVAGIVAADGLVRGVAPDAHLLAYKALGANGFGLTSDVLAALDSILDPDGNPMTDDAPDIVNLSLGSGDDPNGPMSLAADLAVGAGILVIAAAGNSGPGFETVESPGNARRVLAVGAVDDSDGIASFSSRGPAPVTRDIKPELVAPGVGIRSTVPTGTCQLCDPSGYLSLNGTSMASPHVAGAAALLRELHPGWSADQIGAALIQRAVDLPLDGLTAGNGRLDAYAAATALAVGVPSTLDLGLLDPAPPSLTLQRTVTVTNVADRSGTFSFDVPGVLPPGVSATVTPASTSIASGASADVEIELLIDNTALPHVTEPPHAYELTFRILSPGSHLHRVPLAFLKAPILDLRWDEGPFFVTVYDAEGIRGSVATLSFPGTEAELLLPEGDYDIVTLFRGDPAWVVHEDVALTDRTVVEIQRAEAAHTLTLAPVNENGESLKPLDTTRDWHTLVLRHRPSNMDTISFGSARESFRFSNMSDDFLLELSTLVRHSPEGPSYSLYTFEDQGIAGSRMVTNDPADYHRVELHHQVPRGIDQVQSFDFLHVFGANISLETSICFSTAVPVLRWPFVETRFEAPRPYPAFSLGYVNKQLILTPDGQCNFNDADRLLRSELFRGESPSHLAFFFGPSTLVFATDADVLPVGLGPYFWRGEMLNGSSTLFLHPTRLFRDPLLGWRFTDEIPWELRQGGIPVLSGVFSRRGTTSYDTSIPLSMPSGVYELHVDYTDFSVGGVPGHAEAEMLFDLSAVDRNPPFLERFELVADGTWTDVVPPGGAQVLFTVADGSSALSEVTLFLDTGDGPVPLSLTSLGGGAFSASVPSHGVDRVDPPTLATLELIATDLTGNRLTYRVEVPLHPGRDLFADGFESGNLSAWTTTHLE